MLCIVEEAARRWVADCSEQERGELLMFGVIRPGSDVERGVSAAHAHGHCFYLTNGGYNFPGPIGWEGQHGAKEGDRIGMLLDLDQGSMRIYKDDEKLGVMVAEGLSGPLCWAVSMRREGESTRIDSVALRAAWRM